VSINSSEFFRNPTNITHNSQSPTQIQGDKEHRNESIVVHTQSSPLNGAQPVLAPDPTLISDKIGN
jgi:hypothetical protein